MSSNGVIRILENYVRVDGLQFNNTSASNPVGIEISPPSNAYDIRINGCIVKGNSITSHRGINIYNASSRTGTIYICNSVVYDNTNSTGIGIHCNMAGCTLYAYNNTVVNCYTGYKKANGTFRPINCIATDCTDGFNGSFTDEDYCISDVASDLSGAHSQNSAEPTYLDKGGKNFHLNISDTIARGQGTPDPGSGLFNDDIDGVTRDATWDIGADQCYQETSAFRGSRGLFVGA
jgi:hypothetical protein